MKKTIKKDTKKQCCAGAHCNEYTHTILSKFNTILSWSNYLTKKLPLCPQWITINAKTPRSNAVVVDTAMNTHCDQNLTHSIICPQCLPEKYMFNSPTKVI